MPTRRSMSVWGLLALAVALLLAACQRRGGPASETSLLSGVEPSRTVGALEAERITDGRAAARGDFWKTDLTALLSSTGAFVEWDLGKPTPIRSAYLQADHNDRYTLSTSADGVRYETLWVAGPVGGGGQQPRFAGNLDGEARFVRLAAEAGDGKYTIAELRLSSTPSATAPVPRKPKIGLPPGDALRSQILTFALALVAFAFLAFRGAPWWWTALLSLLPALAVYDVVHGVLWAWPVGAREVSLLRAMVAAVAGLAIAREVFAPRRFPASRVAIFSTLGVCAGLSLASFYNLGQAQFWDHKNSKPSMVHNFDMRVYYPVAKYFDELGFDGVYVASVAALAEDDPARPLNKLSGVSLRDLRTHEMRRVADVEADIAGVKRRFSPERWREFKRDMRYFRETMGPRDYLKSMHDHGGNATPVWLAIAHLGFAGTNASNTTLILAGLLDPLLLLIAFIAIGRTFGLRTMLVSMVVFGANDFYMFGTDWAGATLRHDWMAYLALGACALKRERWVLGGALLALAGMIRAFPFLALVGVALPALWWFVDYWRRHGQLPTWALVRQKNRAALRVILGGAACAGALFLASSLLFSFDAWSAWLHKVALLTKQPHLNTVSVRSLIAGWDMLAPRQLEARLPLYVTAVAAYVVAVVVACRGRRPEQAAVLGLCLIPVVFHPANYYSHFVFLLPLIAVETREPTPSGARISARHAGVWLSVLVVCVAQYWTVLEKDTGLHFYYASVLLCVGLAAVLGLAIRDSVAHGSRLGAPAEAAE